MKASMEKIVSDLRELSTAGITLSQAAEKIGIKYLNAARHCRKHGIKFPHANIGMGFDEQRAETMAGMFKGGKTLAEIGLVFGVSRERVRQIITKYHGLTRENGGARVKADRLSSARERERDLKYMKRYGCLYAEYKEIQNVGKAMRRKGHSACRTPIGAYILQRRNAGARGVEWNLTLWDWWKIWESSGKWEMRGREADNYVMCRYLDSGAYAVGNVYIASVTHNCSVQPNNPYRKDHPDHSKVLKLVRNRTQSKRTRIFKPKNPDLPRGVTRQRGRYIAQIGFGGRNIHIGSFSSAQEAGAAYDAKWNSLHGATS